MLASSLSQKVQQKEIENRLTYKKKVLVKISCPKISWKGGKYFTAKNLNSNYLIMIAQNYYKLTQMTYLRQNLHDQVKLLEKTSCPDLESFRAGLDSQFN